MFTAVDNSVSLSKVGGHNVIHVRVMKLYSMCIGLGKQRQVGKQNNVVARKVTEACGLCGLCTVFFKCQ